MLSPSIERVSLSSGKYSENTKIENPIRKEAPKTFQFFKDQGVQIKVISGDNPIAVSQIAQRAKIENADKYIDASTLKTNQDIKNALDKYAVFGRVTPDQKRTFVKVLKENKKNKTQINNSMKLFYYYFIMLKNVFMYILYNAYAI